MRSLLLCIKEETVAVKILRAEETEWSDILGLKWGVRGA